MATPQPVWDWRWIYVGLIGLCFLTGIAVHFTKLRPAIKSRVNSLAWTNVCIGLVLYFARDQRLPYLGMNFLRFLQEVGLIVWINAIIWFARTHIPKEKLAEAVEARRTKYLPKAQS